MMLNWLCLQAAAYYLFILKEEKQREECIDIMMDWLPFLYLANCVTLTGMISPVS